MYAIISTARSWFNAPSRCLNTGAKTPGTILYALIRVSIVDTYFSVICDRDGKILGTLLGLHVHKHDGPLVPICAIK
jgi:hypothetical protein